MSTESNSNSNSEEYMKNYLESNDFQDKPERGEKITSLGKSASELEYIAIDIQELPCSDFYPAGTTVLVRAAKVSEIQSFSVVDDTNTYDVIEKINYLISNCVFLRYPDQSKKPFTHLIDGDRFYLIFVIRELTFQTGNDLYTEVGDIKIPLKRGFFSFHEMDKTIEKYYNKVSGKFIYQTKMGDIEMAPPTLGVTKSFTDYIVSQVTQKKDVNQSFLKIIPFMLPGRTSITKEGIEKELLKFKSMDIDLFQFLNQIVEKMSFGVSGVALIDEGGQEVRSENIFPEGVSGLFVQSDAVENFLI